MRKEEEQENKKKGCQGPASHSVGVKERYTEVRKEKSPEAKGSQDNLSYEKPVGNKAS